MDDKKTKILVNDGNTTFALWGEILSSDENYLEFFADDGAVYKVKQEHIVLTKKLK